MVTLNQVLFALNAPNQDVRVNAANLLVNEFSKNPSNVPYNQLYSIARRLNDSSQLVRAQIGRFLFLYVKSGRELGNIWIYLSRHLGSRDSNVRAYVVQALNYLGKEEHYLKTVLEDARNPQEVRMRASEALTHFYVRRGYLSSLSDLLKRDFATITGTLQGIYVDRQMRLVKPEQLMSIEPVIAQAMKRMKSPNVVTRRPIEQGRRPIDRALIANRPRV